MVTRSVAVSGAAARLFIEQPERLAAAWRRERWQSSGKKNMPDNLLDGVVEDFVRQIGHSLRGVHDAPGSRTRGVLRLSLLRGDRALSEEFSALRRCLVDALAVVGASSKEHAVVVNAVD